MGISERRIREKEQVRAAILSAAWKMVKEEGWQSLSIRRIADAIEYSAPVIYDHFENKEAIMAAFSKEGFRLLSRKVRQAKEKQSDPVKQLKAMAQAYWDFARKNREYYQLMYGVGMACCEDRKTMSEDGFDHCFMETIKTLVAGSKHPKTDVCLKYHTLWSILHGLVSIRITGNSPASGQLNQLVLEDAIDGYIKNLA